jgi:hypothetical protein
MCSQRKCAHKFVVEDRYAEHHNDYDMTWYVLARHDCNGDSAIDLQLVNEKAAY